MQIKIRCLKIEKSCNAQLYTNWVSCPDGVAFDFQGLTKVLKVLYPKTDVVEFSISLM